MRCTHCGADIPDDQMFCPVCGAEVQIVPDYNPLDDVLAREVRGSVEGATRPLASDDIRRYRRDIGAQNENSTRVLSQGEMDRIREERRAALRRSGSQNQQSGSGRNTGRMRQGTGTGRMRQDSETGRMRSASENGRNRQNQGAPRRSPEERRRQQEKRLQAARRKRRNLLLFLFVMLVLIALGVYVIYQNSYTGVVRKGYRALQTDSYTEAENYFNRAITKDESRAEAYVGLSEIYIDQDDLDSAESVFLTALETQTSNVGLYQAVISFYMDTEQQAKISTLLENCEDSSVLEAVSDYVSKAPEFVLEPGTYDEVQEVALESETGGTIYYTTDGTDPTTSSTKYTEPILLQDEGTTEIRAIAVNKNEIPSVVSSGTYTIEFPIASAPTVVPATGSYDEPAQITITVPDGYTAYYTLDGTTPTAESSKYTGPVTMPENQRTIFSAVLINDQNGKATAVTIRSYTTGSAIS